MQEQKPGTVSADEEDLDLALTMERAAQVLERLGISVDDVLDELAVLHAEQLDDAYGADYMRDIERRIAEHQRSASSPQPHCHD
jgi:hypothetical protein